MTALADLVTSSPTLVVGVVTSLLILLTTFGVKITDDQQKALLGFLTALLAIAGAIWAHNRNNANTDAAVKIAQAPGADLGAQTPATE